MVVVVTGQGGESGLNGRVAEGQAQGGFDFTDFFGSGIHPTAFYQGNGGYVQADAVSQGVLGQVAVVAGQTYSFTEGNKGIINSHFTN